MQGLSSEPWKCSNSVQFLISTNSPKLWYSFYKLIFVEINYPTKQYSKEYPINEKKKWF